jgi:hypothetical protein
MIRMTLHFLAAWLIAAGTIGVCDDQLSQPKVSSYAPAGDLIAQVDYFVKHASEALADKAGYDEARQATVERDSNTLAVLALLLAMHDKDHKLKAAAPAVLKASQALAEKYEDYDASVAALAEVKKAVAGEAPAGDPVGWDAVGAFMPLMEQTPIVQAPMKRGATDARRLKRQAAQTAGQAATLAAIAQASSFVTDYVTDEQLPEWEKYCVDMRDACAAVNTAVRNGDAAKAAEAIVALQKSCDDCHAAFKDE